MRGIRLYFALCVPFLFLLCVFFLFSSLTLQHKALLAVVAVVASGLTYLLVRRVVKDCVVDGEAQQYTHKILQASLEGIITADKSGKVVEFNPAAEQIFGYSRERAVGCSLTELIIPDRLKGKHTESFHRFMDTGEQRIMDTRIEVPAVDANGREFPVEMTLTHIELDGEVLVTAFLRDLTERKQAEEGAEIAKTVFTKASEGIMVTGSNNCIKAVNPAFLRITGYEQSEVIGQQPSMLSSGRHSEQFYRDVWANLEKSGVWEGEIWNRRKDGDIYPQQLSIAAIKDSAGAAAGYVAVFSDITQRKEVEKQLVHQATHDPLTGLPNRLLFFDRLAQAMAAGRREERVVAVLFADLDNFKPVNDLHGHLVGDQLLKEVGGRLSLAVREVDTIARFGGDEFALVLPNVEQEEFAETVAEKLLNLICKPYVIDGKKLTIGCSIGIAFYPKDGEEVDKLVSRADEAMYCAKSSGGDCYNI